MKRFDFNLETCQEEKVYHRIEFSKSELDLKASEAGLQLPISSRFTFRHPTHKWRLKRSLEIACVMCDSVVRIVHRFLKERCDWM